MTASLRIISSMATRQLLAELTAIFERSGPYRVELESVGGVDAARRVEAGESFDAVILASNAIDKLIDAGRIVPGSRVDLVQSGVSIAVPAGAPAVDVGSEEAVRQAVLAARTVSYSTGPSGVHLARLFERWGIAEQIKDRIVQAPPGVPVGSLVARGEVALGFQQLSELINLDGIAILGPLPDKIQIITRFSAGVAATCRQPAAVQALIAFLASPETAAAKIAQGMAPA
ncbi:MAG: Aconitate isomerase [Paracidovorax wautersii]|uniref:Aconitate isomerase n=1 Tax=Paracidovorax wautersii TaxID=1177982 RepID=A0A7V8JR69_9BURK|nr:MAG: Aconitate isomerase [Paracidovorax wautersii]